MCCSSRKLHKYTILKIDLGKKNRGTEHNIVAKLLLPWGITIFPTIQQAKFSLVPQQLTLPQHTNTNANLNQPPQSKLSLDSRSLLLPSEPLIIHKVFNPPCLIPTIQDIQIFLKARNQRPETSTHLLFISNSPQTLYCYFPQFLQTIRKKN